MLSPAVILSVLGGYFALLLIISYFTGKGGAHQEFFIGNRNSRWYVVAFGMIGASLSGVTFISIPGWVGGEGFSYMQMVLGYLLGYWVIAQVLLPLYYKLNLTSIYTYLVERFGNASYKTGSAFFLLSRIIGASFRLYLVAIVLDKFVFEPWGVPFGVTVFITIGLIWIYSFKGGINTIVWTDTLQTLFMLLAVGLAVYQISTQLNWSLGEMVTQVSDSRYSDIWVWEWSANNHFFKHLLSGMFITIVMTGLDQDMMQKNLSCRNLAEAKRNVYTMSTALVPINLLFLTLGALLFLYAQQNGLMVEHYDAIAQGKYDGPTDKPFSLWNETENAFVPTKADQLFPTLALDYLGPLVGLFFVIGLVAAAYSSADSALTSLTTAFCIDFMGAEHKTDFSKRTRYTVHLAFSIVLGIVIIIFKELHNDSLVKQLFQVAGYTYGPLLGLYSFGLFTRKRPVDKWVPYLAIACALGAYGINHIASTSYDFQFGFLILLVNGALMFTGLWLLSLGRPNMEKQPTSG